MESLFAFFYFVAVCRGQDINPGDNPGKLKFPAFVYPDVKLPLANNDTIDLTWTQERGPLPTISLTLRCAQSGSMSTNVQNLVCFTEDVPVDPNAAIQRFEARVNCPGPQSNCVFQIAGLEPTALADSIMFDIEPNSGTSKHYPHNTSSITDSAQLIPVTLQGDELINLTACENGDSVPDCWSRLNLSEWTKTWIDTADPCLRDNTCNQGYWSRRFLVLAQSQSAFPSDIEGKSCNPPSIKPLTNPSHEERLLHARYYLVGLTICGIRDYFNGWYNLISDLMNEAQDTISPITNIINPQPKKRSFWKTLVTTLINVIVTFIPELKVGYTIAKGIGTAISSILSDQWPEGQDTQDVQEDALRQILASVQDGTLDNLNQTLQDAQAAENFVNFTHLADTGRFLSDAPSITDFDLDAARLAIKTLIASVSLDKNDWYSLVMPGLDPSSTYKKPENCPNWAGEHCKTRQDGDLGCQGVLGDYSTCGYLWYSSAQKSTYALVKRKGNDKDKASKIMNQLISEAYITGQSLFESALSCELRSLFPPSAQANYTTPPSGVSGGEGFTFNISPEAPQNLLVIDTRVVQNGDKGFYGIDGGDIHLPNQWVELYQRNKATKAKFVHPVYTLEGLDQSSFVASECTSQLDVSVANSWEDAGFWQYFDEKVPD